MGNTKVLITGGAGFIGTRLARELLRRGNTVTIMDNFSPQVHGQSQNLPPDLAEHVELVRGDVRDRDAWTQALPRHNVIVHLAAETGTGQSMYEVSLYEQVNIGGTALLYDTLCRNPRHTIERIVVASSRAIYGEGAYLCPQDGVIYPRSRKVEDKAEGHFDPICPLCSGACSSIPTTEEAPFQPSSFYGLTKQTQEQTANLFATVLHISTFALRYQNVYGPGQSLKNPYTGILAIFSNLARAGSDINVFEDGLESRDFVYIDDVVSATAASITSTSTSSHIVNVGSGQRVTVLEVAKAVNAYFGNQSSLRVSGSFREGDIRHGLASLELLNKTLGYQPSWSFRDGLQEFLSWAASGEPSSSNYKHSLDELKQHGMFHAQ